MWRARRSQGSVLLDMISSAESPLKQHLSQITVATSKEGSLNIAEINFDPFDPAIDHILKQSVIFTLTISLISCEITQKTLK